MGCQAWVKVSPTCFSRRERQTVVLGRHPDHIGGPARSTNIKPIFDVASALLSVYPFSCPVVRPPRMVHWWRIVEPSVMLNFSFHDSNAIITFTASIHVGMSSKMWPG